MIRVTVLENYADDDGNVIDYPGRIDKSIQIKFTGRNNRVIVHENARISRLFVDLDCDNGLLEIGPSAGVPPLLASIRIGQDSTVRIGNNVSSTAAVAMSATEGTSITVGDDVMFASENQVRADDAHPIFDVRTGLRVNVSRSISIGSHVWLARASVVLGGVTIGDGSVIGYGSIVTRSIPNNCIAAGTPAAVLRRDIAWERPHLSMVKPYYKPDGSTVKKSAYWHLTEPIAERTSAPQGATRAGRAEASRLRRRARSAAGRVVRRLRR